MIIAASLVLSAVPDPSQRPLISDVAVSYDNKWVAVSYSRNAVHIYRLTDGKKLRTLTHKPGSRLVDIELSADGKTILVSNMNYAGIPTPIWSTDTWKESAKIGIWVNKRFCLPVVDPEFGDKGRLLFGRTLQSRSFSCWDPKTGSIKYQARATGPNLWISYATSPVSSLVAIRDVEAGTIKFWDVEDRQENLKWGRTIKGIDINQARSLRFSRDGEKLLVTLARGPNTLEFKVCTPANGYAKVSTSTIITGFEQRDSDWSPDGSKVYFTGLKGQIVACDIVKRTPAHRWVGHGGQPVKAIATDMTGKVLVTGGGNTVCFWDTSTYKLLRTIRIGG